jgi:hypothetical protein
LSVAEVVRSFGLVATVAVESSVPFCEVTLVVVVRLPSLLITVVVVVVRSKASPLEP